MIAATMVRMMGLRGLAKLVMRSTEDGWSLTAFMSGNCA